MSDNIRNILVIGNGFDLDHGLPTKYSDFMKYIKEHLSSSSGDVKDKNTLLLLKHLTEKNLWYDYFDRLEKDSLLGGNWIDFEKEISTVIQYIDELTQNLDDRVSAYIIKRKTLNSVNIKDKIKLFHLSYNEKIDLNSLDPITFRQLRKRLFDDLQQLKCALEIYLNHIGDTYTPTSQSKALGKLAFKYIISFNYTHTAERVFPNAEVVYIHGDCKERAELLGTDSFDIQDEINKAIAQNNMVLGIDEYYEDERMDTHTNYVTFKKFVQRIQNQNIKFTANQFMPPPNPNSLGEISLKMHVHFFGHSLDVTDSDILGKIFNHRVVDKFTIYCYDRLSQGEYIANIIKLIGQRQLIEFMESEKIEFLILNS